MSRKKTDKAILQGLLGFGFLALPWLLLRKRPFKDWIMVFSMKGVYASILDSLVVKQKRVTYPIRFLSKAFKINVLFDYLLFPVTCIFYNQITQHSKLPGILGKAFFFTIPMTIMETGFVKKTNLIKWKKTLISRKKKWTWYYTLISLTITFWLDRALIGLIRRVSRFSFVKTEQKDP